MNFSEHITKIRKNAGLTQAELAFSLNMARATYAGLEIAKRSPNLDEIIALAEYYQIDPSDLISGRNQSDDNDPSKALDIRKETEPNLETPKTFDLDYCKFRAVLLYIIEKIGAKPNVGETVLYKILYFIDFDYYEKSNRPITGMTYVHNHFGPTPATKSFKDIISKMKSDSDIETIETKRYSHTQKKYLPLKHSDLSCLQADQLKHIDFELARLGDMSATELTDLSHKDTPWLATKNKEAIDYQLVKYRTPETSVIA